MFQTYNSRNAFFAALLSTVFATVLAMVLGSGTVSADRVPEHEIVKRIVFGNAVPRENHPWAVRLGIAGEANYRHCSAFLINPEWIVTAWHCTVDSENNDSNFAPSYLYYSLFVLDGNSSPFRRITEIIRHPLARQYKNTTLFHDIALLRVQSPHYEAKALNMYLDTVSDDDINQLRTENNSDFFATGWGYEESMPASYSIELREAQIPILNSSEISSFIVSTDYEDEDGNTPQWTEEDALNQLFAGHFEFSGSESCTGDSGGPLFRQHNNHTESVGWVVSGFGTRDDCGRPGYAGIYGRLNREADFLINHLGLGIVNHPAQTDNSHWSWLNIMDSTLPDESWHADGNLLGHNYICRVGKKAGIFSRESGGCLTLNEDLLTMVHTSYELVIGAAQYDFSRHSSEQSQALESNFSSCTETNYCTPAIGYETCEYYCINQQTSDIGIIKNEKCMTHNIVTGVTGSSDFLRLVRTSTDTPVSICPTSATTISQTANSQTASETVTLLWATPDLQETSSSSVSAPLKVTTINIGILFSLRQILYNR